jgi:hypothetical protein
MSDQTAAEWRKPSRSNGSGGECVEVADNLSGVVLVRDTKDRDGGTLAFPPDRWQAFVRFAKQSPTA